jgi:hypothetical protein
LRLVSRMHKEVIDSCFELDDLIDCHIRRLDALPT